MNVLKFTLPELDPATVSRGDVVFTQGAPAEYFDTIVEGKVSVSPDGGGDAGTTQEWSFGELDFLQGKPRMAIVRAPGCLVRIALSAATLALADDVDGERDRRKNDTDDRQEQRVALRVKSLDSPSVVPGDEDHPQHGG